MKINKQITYSTSGQRVNIQNGEQAVAFEIKDNNKVVYFSTSFEFKVPGNIALDRVKLYAVQADGARFEITKK